MRCTGVALCIVVVMPLSAAAENPSLSTETLLEASLRLANTLQPEEEETETVRSAARTWGGVAIAAGGLAILIATAGDQCVESDAVAGLTGYRTCNQIRTIRMVGALTAGFGISLATVFAKVPVARELTLSAGPDRVQVGKTVSF